MVQPVAEPRIEQIADGVWAQTEDRSAPLPRHLEAHEGRLRPCTCRPLLGALRDVVWKPVPVMGTRLACRDQHEFVEWVTGTYRTEAPDPRSLSVELALRILVCRFCGAVQVRDISIDRIVDVAADGRRRSITKPGSVTRRDTVLGMYAGRRSAGRQFL